MKRLLILITAFISLNNFAFASDYYDQFMVKVYDKCKTTGMVETRMASNFINRWVLGENSDGIPTRGKIGLEIHADGTYYAYYGEVTETSPTSGYFHFRKSVTGNWYINSNNQLMFKGLGMAMPTTIIDENGNEQNALKFEMDTVLNDKRVLKNPIALINVRSSTAPKGLTIDEYCNR